MARWQPDARGRLTEAALELYAEHGYEATTVKEIADRAGLTERTFFRHFADKREVLFGGSEELAGRFWGAIAQAPESAAPMDAVVAGLEAIAASFFDGRRPHSTRRQAIIDANPALQERELAKLHALAAGAARELRERGTTEPTASITAEAGIVVFKVSFERWLSDPAERDFAAVQADVLTELRSTTAVG